MFHFLPEISKVHIQKSSFHILVTVIKHFGFYTVCVLYISDFPFYVSDIFYSSALFLKYTSYKHIILSSNLANCDAWKFQRQLWWMFHPFISNKLNKNSCILVHFFFKSKV